ncbi:hypothetical protein Taro_053292 [Colocasia esculenta]|uniref:Uncharacterized protein n=1 Tax=Colocasia esculenta TaxID=4460 RepID=A0A843XKS4_COLES|nr:hypothetical protein [Colocasia esculenta]
MLPLSSVNGQTVPLTMASRGRRGGAPAREGEQRREEQVPEPQGHERADVWWASLLHTRFEDGAIEVA